ncbi:uncharacterized protein LOC131695495 [Topomyia yanbarensis]|uniref:uncharacterized protein LOC131695495 n=1 Tax=Topomyia yanbarensis TaxID=2498891 RepID=UPI00273C4B8D|nr:uncharacterized protein LOC131695495 [Topomyia yanbarensis]
MKKVTLRKNTLHHKTLLRRRNNILGSAKLIQQFDDQYEETQVNQVSLRIARLDELWKTFEGVQDEIEVIEDKQEDFAESRQEFHDLYFELKASLTSKLPRNDPVPGTPVPQIAQQIAPPVHQVVSVKLPELKMPEFDGQPEQWIEFRDLFKSVIHSNVQLSAVQKLHYLRSSLKGDASRLISSIAISADNYAIAWKIISDRYENTGYLVKQHMSALFRVPSVRRGSASALSELADEFNRHVGILDKLEDEDAHWNSFLVERLSSLLDERSLLEWETQCKEEEVPQYSVLLEFIRKRSRTLQKCSTASGSSSNVQVKPIKVKTTSSHVASENVVKCLSCKQAHSLVQCEAFIKLSANNRFDFVKKHRLCINCLRGGHMAKDCRASFCRTCGKKHHSMLHLPAQLSTSAVVVTPSEEQSPSTSQVYTAICSVPTTTSQSDIAYSVVNAPPVVLTSTLPQAIVSVSQNVSSPLVAIDAPLPPSPVVSYESEPLPYCTQQPATSLTQANNTFESIVFLSTAVVRVRDVNNVYHFARALLDSGSQSNFVSESLCQKLDLKRSRVNLPVSGIGQSTVNVHYKVQIALSSRFGGFEQQIDCLVLPKLTVSLPSRSVDISRWTIPRHLPLADPRFNISQGVDLIVGAELFYTLLESQRLTLTDGYPILQKTVLGYVVSGKATAHAPETVVCHVAVDQDLNAQLERMWEVEDFDVGRALTQEEQQVEEHFIRTVTRDSSGRYMVRLPLKESRVPFLGDSYKPAVNRFSMMERRFAKDNELRVAYTQFMEEYIKLGHMEECSRGAGPQFCLPHHAVRRPESTTTKTRVVFDASSKSHGQLSLNEVLFTGPTVQPALLAVVANFRVPKYVFSADAEKMFRQVWMHPDDRKFLTVAWRSDPSLPLKFYQLKTVTYGLACSPYQAARVLNKLAEDDGDRYPLAAPIVTKCFYVDDALAGGDDLDEVAESCRQLQELLARGGFTLRKWYANDSNVLRHIPSELCGTPGPTEIGRGSITTALGLIWNPCTDQLSFQVPDLGNLQVVTKRTVVSEMSRLFDPLGLLGPVVISARIFVQGLWARQLGWDEELPEQDGQWWQVFRDELAQLKKITVSRHVVPNCRQDYQLHCFCDASSKGYGCCIYVVGPNVGGKIESKLLIAKSRVAPLRGLSIPRLELCAAVLGSQLIHNLRTTTDFQGPAVFWSDSTVVLHWIKSPPNEWKVFVSNRVAEVQRLTRGVPWNYVPTELNPADLISRGINPSQIIDDRMWWYGPPLLTKPTMTWPKFPSNSSISHNIEQEKRAVVVLTTTEIDDSIFVRYSELGKLLKVVAMCIRFGTNCRCPKAVRVFGNLTPAEIDRALKSMVRLAQVNSFPKEIQQLKCHKLDPTKPIEFDTKSALKTLNIRLDQSDHLRLDGRLVNAAGPYDSKFPLILPAKHPLSFLIARSLHHRTAHAGPGLLLATMRQRFWPMRGRELVRNVVRKCITCFRCRPADYHQQMAPLPAVRVVPSRVFSKAGLDYCGPFNVRPLYGRGANVKMYVAIFVCLAVKAVHIEIVPNLTSAACINAIKRFVARRGRLIELQCDNATAFVGADRELKSLRRRYLEQFKTEEWKGYCIDSGISFRFIPARSPHFGGLWEAGVKSFKHHFRRIFGASSYTLDEFTTAATHIESILNSRPLTPLTDHPDDLAVLTPGHFLVGEPMFSIPEPDMTNDQVSRLSRWQELRRSVQNFWKRWSRDYISQLHQRTKWRTPAQNIYKGALVLLKQEELPPFMWNIGRVEETYTAADGLVRVVLVRTNRGVYKRAVTEVRVLPIDGHDTNKLPTARMLDDDR